MMENVLSFMRAAAPWISMGLLIAFLCVRPAIRKGKAEDDYAEEGMCVGMCLGLMLGSLSDSSNSGLGASLGMLFGLVIGLCMHKKGTEDRGNENKRYPRPHDQQTVSLRRKAFVFCAQRVGSGNFSLTRNSLPTKGSVWQTYPTAESISCTFPLNRPHRCQSSGMVSF